MENETFRYLDKTKIQYIYRGVLVGALAGVVVSLFRLAIEELGSQVAAFYRFTNSHPQWLILWFAISIVISIFVGLLIKSDPNIKGSGIPQVEGQLNDQLSTNWLSVLCKKFAGGVLSVGMGLFLGREGPSIQLGASVGQGFSKITGAGSTEEKILISSGASAGLSAAFNAPIAGLLFVVEEVHHNFSPLVWLTSFASAITANFVSLTFFGLEPVLHLGEIPSLPLDHYWLLLILGVILGILGRIYQIVLLSLERWYNLIPLPKHFDGLVPFLLVIPIGYFFPNLLGGGNQIVLQLGQDLPLISLLLALLALRFIFSMVSYGASLPGGIFLPILTLGAIIGAIFGSLSVSLLGMDPIYVKDFVVIAMAGYFAAIGKAPLTAIVLVTEMVGSLVHLMPLGVAALVAYIVVDSLGGNPIYESLLERLVQNKSSDLSGRKVSFEWPVTAESALAGVMVRDFNWPKEMLLISIRRGNQELLIHGDTVLQIGDTLTILTDTQHLDTIRNQIILRSQQALA